MQGRGPLVKPGCSRTGGAARENVVKKKRARPKARDQIWRGRKVAANTVGSTILVFASQLCQTLGDGLFFPLAISFWELANYNK